MDRNGFLPSEYLRCNQIAAFFSRLASAAKRKEANIPEQSTVDDSINAVIERIRSAFDEELDNIVEQLEESPGDFLMT